MVMKKLVVFLFGIFAAVSAFAQDNSAKDLTFIYIAHDENTPTQTLISRLQANYEDAKYYPDSYATIFYLTNGDNPIIVKMNVEGENPKDFDKLIEDLQAKRAHDVSPETDREKIMELFDEIDLLDAEGNNAFNSVQWNYYVNSTFWLLNNNEHVIASLFWIMDMEPMVKSGYLQVNILHGEIDPLPVDEKLPFGSKALCRAMPFIPMPY